MEKVSEPLLRTKWKRPVSVPYPHTWHKFTTKSKDGEIYNMKIVDLTPDRFEEGMDFMEKYFYPYEPLSSSLKLMEDEVSFDSSRKQRKNSEQDLPIVAVLDEDVPKPEIVGLLRLRVVSRYDEPVSNIHGVALQKIVKLMSDLKKDHDLFTMFGTNQLIQDSGLCVKSEYRGLNIGYNLIATMEKLANIFGFKASFMQCTSIQSQKIAEKVGFRLLKEILYSEYKDEQGREVYPIEGVKSIKLMAIEYV